MALILFYTTKGPHGCFTNFSRHSFDYNGKTWPTSEHAFQAMKFWPEYPEFVNLIWTAKTPKQAAEIGRNKNLPLRADWELRPTEEIVNKLPTKPKLDNLFSKCEPIFARVKDVLMYEVCLAKFSQNEEIKQILLSTGNDTIVEDSPIDSYWGWGANRSGENKLGRILMIVRDVLKG